MLASAVTASNKMSILFIEGPFRFVGGLIEVFNIQIPVDTSLIVVG